MAAAIVHIAESDAWERARDAGSYVPEGFEADGFVHCSFPDQVVGVANALFAGRTDLVLLLIDPERLSSPLRLEHLEPDAPPEAPVFPHVYGPIDVAAVVDVVPFRPGANGRFQVPDRIAASDNRSLGELWARQADEWVRFVRTPGHDKSHERVNGPPFFALLPPPGDLTVDLGCGEGRLVRALRARGHRIVGVDVSSGAVRAAAEADPAGWYVEADAARLPLHDGSADLVLAYMSLHDMDDFEGAVAESARVLRGGGRFCVALLHPIATAGRWEERAADAPYVIDSAYAETRRLLYVSDRGGIRVEFGANHRSLESVLLPMEHAGLLIERLREIGAPDDLVEEDPAEGRWQRLPLFLQIRAVKASGGGTRA